MKRISIESHLCSAFKTFPKILHWWNIRPVTACFNWNWVSNSHGQYTLHISRSIWPDLVRRRHNKSFYNPCRPTWILPSIVCDVQLRWVTTTPPVQHSSGFTWLSSRIKSAFSPEASLNLNQTNLFWHCKHTLSGSMQWDLTIYIAVLTRTQEVNSTYWNILKISKTIDSDSRT